MGCTIILGLVAFAATMPAYWIAEDKGRLPELYSFLRGLRWPLAVWAAVLVSTNFIPSRDTFYAIAASEMGEQALKTPIATKAGKALEKWLDEQIGDKPNGDGK